jgi:hypothetical protein
MGGAGNRSTLLTLLLVLVSSQPTACGQSGESQAYDLGCQGDLAGVDFGAPPDLAGPPVACNMLQNSAPVILQTQVDQPMPPPKACGGAIAPGTYYLTSWTLYQGSISPPQKLQIMQSITESTIQQISSFMVIDPKTGMPRTDNVIDTRLFATSGQMLTEYDVCGVLPPPTFTLQYDVTPTGYRTYADFSVAEYTLE